MKANHLDINRQENTDFEVRSLDSAVAESYANSSWSSNLKYLIVGIVFGIILVKAEVMSWFRIQEMFRLQSFHMFGIIGSAVIVGMTSVWIIKKFRIKSFDGQKIEFHPKRLHKGNIFGGLLFGVGWALTGACPGPLFAQIGTGSLVTLVTLFSAIAGTWTYGLIRERLPH